MRARAWLMVTTAPALGVALACGSGPPPAEEPRPSPAPTTAPTSPEQAMEAARAAIRGSRFASQAPAIEASLRLSLLMEAQVTAMRAIPVGASHFAGEADLPAGMEWPRYLGRPLAQLDLEDIAPYDAEHLLPSSGWWWS